MRNPVILNDLVACDLCITPSRWQQQQFPGVFQPGMTVLHDGVDTEYFSPAPATCPVPGIQWTGKEEIITYAKKLQEKGAQNVLISMAGDGAILLTSTGEIFQCPAPKGRLVNSVGAGDSMVAGFITGYAETHSFEQAFHMGVATGSASAFSENLAARPEVEALLKTIA